MWFVPPLLYYPFFRICKYTLSTTLSMWNFRSMHHNQTTHKNQTQTSTRTGCRWEGLNTAAWDPLTWASSISHEEIWGYNDSQGLFSLRERRSISLTKRSVSADLFCTFGCAREGGEGGSGQQGAEKQESAGDAFCSAPSCSPALVHLLCNLKLPVSNIIYGTAQAESQNQEAKSSFPDIILHPGYYIVSLIS